jgi:DNA-binding transcriptional MerR regulator
MTAAERDQVGTISIGEVLNQLRGDFPDVTISKIRFLDIEGLVAPARTPSGYRKFASGDVARLRYVLTQQRDHYLPLRVIKEQLDALDNGLRPAGPGGVPRSARIALAEVPTAEDFQLHPAALRLSREELLNAAGLRAEQLQQLEQFSLVKAGSGDRFDDDALAVAKIVGELSRFGLEGRHLRPFRTAADREIGLFSQVVGPLAKQRNSEARARAQDTIRELAALSVALHAALVRAGLRDTVSGG